ncbi:MAG: peptidase dimerization domain-containing protein [bacterium]|nr:peptidase dimerization domain-containing protein [bacterium]MDZ4295851.1 peptidase dimerization domain-containing protein [Patescibacteria group bacterium]MDZ4295862.1 peptidase dimerization domain-containing protein [Patescibacteria group bacterium]
MRVDGTFVGKVVHPREPEKGINALQIACEALEKLPWGYSSDGVTWNVGMFQAGTARNSVPGSATFKAELRSYETAKVVADARRIERICKEAAERHGGQCDFDGELEFKGYRLEHSHPLFERLGRTFQSMGLTPNYYATFGGSDANIFNSRGITSVPIGSGYFNAHEYTECADISAMAEIVEFLKRFAGV